MEFHPDFFWMDISSPRRAQVFYTARSRRAGNKINAATSSSAPWTAIPRRRNGRRSSQTIGYRTTANNASGQHRINKMHQRINLTMIASGCTKAKVECSLFCTQLPIEKFNRKRAKNGRHTERMPARRINCYKPLLNVHLDGNKLIDAA